MNEPQKRRLPSWLKMKMPLGDNYSRVKNLVKQHQLHTICSSGNCPNIGECWSCGTATFMILGDICTRACKFCAVKTGKPHAVDADEPLRLANSIKLLNLKHCVITSVDRDDLYDKGSQAWADTIREIKRINPDTTIEVLIPDMDGDKKLLKTIIDARPNIISHNLETVERLTPQIRTRAKYQTSLSVLKYISSEGIVSKTGIMLGLGETFDEVYKTLEDVISVDCRIITIGQYLAPTKNHMPVVDYIHPDVFLKIGQTALKMGFKHVESSPLVRSSYHAQKHI